MSTCSTEDTLRVFNCSSEMHKSVAMYRMAGGFAHEVRNPLAIIRMGLDNVARNLPEKPERALGYMDDLYHCIERIDDIIKLLLDCRAANPLSVTAFHPEKLVEAARERVSEDLDKSDISFEVRCDDDVNVFNGDRERAEEAVVHLLTNAIEAMAPGGQLTVNIYTSDVPHPMTREALPGLCIEVCDNGTGMDEETMTKVADPFFTTRIQHLGLGMSTVCTVMQQHGGQMHIGQRTSGGTAVRLYFPYETLEPISLNTLPPEREAG